MKMKKRFLSILLSLVMVLGLMPGMTKTAYADNSADNLRSDGFELGNRPASVTEEREVTNLFDNQNGTKWDPFWPSSQCDNTGLSISIKFHTTNPVVVEKYELWPGDSAAQGYGSRFPKAWTLYGSDSIGGSWEVVDAKASGDYLPTTPNTGAAFAVPNNTRAYQYYKLTVTEVGKENGFNPYTGNNCYYFELSEIKLYT